MSNIGSPVLSPPQNACCAIPITMHAAQSRSTTRAHNINTVKCTLCNNMVSSSSFNSHLVKCHNASSNQIKRMPMKTNLPSSPQHMYSVASNVSGQTVFQNEQKIKFHNYVPEREAVIKSDNTINSPKPPSNTSLKGSDSRSPKSSQKLSSLQNSKYDIQLCEAVKPKSLDNILGQDFAVNQMKHILKEFRESNFSNVLVTGPLGSGKTTLFGILERFIKTEVEANFLDIGVHEGKEFSRKISNSSKPAFLLLDNLHLLKDDQEETLIEILTNGQNIFLIGTASDLTNMMLPKSLSKVQQVTLEKFDNSSIYKILENAKAHLTTILESKEGEKLDITSEVLEKVVSLCNGSASNALSHFQTLVALNDMSHNQSSTSPRDDNVSPVPNSKLGDKVLASLVTSVVNIPQTPLSLSSTLSDIKTALNFKLKKPAHPNNSSNTKTHTKTSTKRPNKQDALAVAPDPKRFFPSNFQSPQPNVAKVNVQALKQELPASVDVLKMYPFKCIPIAASNGTTPSLAATFPTPIFVTHPLASPPVVVKSTEKPTVETKPVLINGTSKLVDASQLINLGGNAVQGEQGNLIWTLYFAMLTGNSDSALLVLTSLLQGGVKPLTIAQELVAFASLYIGLSDTNALQTALLAYQSCQSLPSTHTTILLTQVVMQLTKCTKSTETRDKYFQLQMQLARIQN